MSSVIKSMGGVFVVLPGCEIRWPDGTLRGEAGYALRGDDPHFRPSDSDTVERDDAATPSPSCDWPDKYRATAGPGYLSRAELEEILLRRERASEDQESIYEAGHDIEVRPASAMSATIEAVDYDPAFYDEDYED